MTQIDVRAKKGHSRYVLHTGKVKGDGVKGGEKGETKLIINIPHDIAAETTHKLCKSDVTLCCDFKADFCCILNCHGCCCILNHNYDIKIVRKFTPPQKYEMPEDAKLVSTANIQIMDAIQVEEKEVPPDPVMPNPGANPDTE